MAKSSTKRFDVAIVGAGPIGLEVAIALKKAGLNIVQFDARQMGYTISWFAPQTRFFSSPDRIAIAGVPLHTPDQSKASREEYLAYLRSVVEQFDLHIRTYEKVIGIDGADENFELTTQTADGKTHRYHTRKIVLATGGTDRPRRLNIPGEDLPHVSHYFQDPHTYFQKRLLIVGGRNSAVEAALRCARVGARVSISYRGKSFDERSIKYWLTPEIKGLIASGQIDAHWQTTPTAIHPQHVTLATANSSIDVPADFVLLLIGYEADMTLFQLAGIKLTGAGQAPAYDDATMQTSVPGIYLAGTAVCGTQNHYSVFIENCHHHAPKIVASITGNMISEPAPPMEYARPES